MYISHVAQVSDTAQVTRQAGNCYLLQIYVSVVQYNIRITYVYVIEISLHGEYLIIFCNLFSKNMVD